MKLELLVKIIQMTSKTIFEGETSITEWTGMLVP